MIFAQSIVELGNDTREFFICLAKYQAGLIAWCIAEIVNEVIAIFFFVVTAPALVIPALQFEVPTIPADTLGYINWIFPLSYFVPLYGSAISAYGVYRVLRWRSRRSGIPYEPMRGS